MHQRVSQRGIDFLTGLSFLPAWYLKEVGPVDDARMRHETRSRAVGENVARGTTRVQHIPGADLAMPEAISSIGELHRNKWELLKGIEARAVGQHILHQRIANT